MSTVADMSSDWDWERSSSTEAEAATTASAAITGGDLEQIPVVVWEAANPLEAQVVKGRLESEGIPAMIRGEALGSVYGFTVGSLAQTDVLVPAALAEKATEILNSEVGWVEDDEQEN